MHKFAKGNNSKNAKGDNLKKWLFFKFSPLILLHKLSKFEAPSVIVFDISWLQNLITALLNGQNSTKGDNPDLSMRYQVFYVQICKGQ